MSKINYYWPNKTKALAPKSKKKKDNFKSEIPNSVFFPGLKGLERKNERGYRLKANHFSS